MSKGKMLPVFRKHDPQYYTRFDEIERRLLDTISIIAIHECPAHDRDTLCNCPTALASVTPKLADLLVYIHFVQEWGQHLLKHEACFHFTNDKSGKRTFRSTHGSSAHSFVEEFANETFAAPAMTAPKHSLDATIGAMYAYWADRAIKWRQDHGTFQAARTGLAACQPGDAGFEDLNHLAIRDPNYPPQIGKRLKLQRFRLHGTPDGLHRTMVYLLPARDTLDGMRWVFLGLKPCHENCNVWRLRLTRSIFEKMFRSLHGLGGPEVELRRSTATM